MATSIKQIKKYNTNISKLFKIIISLNEEQQEMLLKYAELLPKKGKRANERKSCHINIFFATSEKVYPSYIENISPTGSFIKTDEPIPVGGKIIILINFEGIDKTLKIRGEIAHATGEGVGVKFKDLVPPVANNLKNIIAHMQN